MAVFLADLELEHWLINGAGTCKTIDDVNVMAQSCVAGVVVGSITVDAREGNPGTTYWECDGYSLNSLGLPNPGLAYYASLLPEMAKIVHGKDKILVVSVAGSSISEYVRLATLAADSGADLIELNLGCPNVWDGGRQKRIPSFELAYTGQLCRQVAAGLRAAARAGEHAVSFGVKISPFSDPYALNQLAESLAELAGESPEFRFVTATNTFPNALALDQHDRPQISMGLAGLGGPAMKPIALGHVKQLRQLLPEQISLIGVGGVTCGRDLADYLAVGATAVQATTAYCGRRGGPGVFDDILSGYLDSS